MRIYHISTSTKLMVSIFGRLVSSPEGTQPAKLRDPAITWPHEVMWQIKNDISPLPRRLWLPNLERKRFIIKDHHPLSLLTLWTRDQVITWLIKNVIFLLPRELWLRNLTEWWVPMQAYYPQSYITCWSRGHIKSCNKWKTL